MPLPLGAVTSDNHLQVSNWAKYPELKGDSFHGFTQVIDFCCREKMQLFVAGDVTHRKYPDAATVGFLMDSVERMFRNGLSVNYIEGQHEMSPGRTWFSCHSWPFNMHEQLFQPHGGSSLAGYGLSYTPADQIKEAIAKIPPSTEILFAHQVWKERMGNMGATEAAFADLPGHIKMVITGDFHGHRIDEWPNRDGVMMTVVSPGSTYMRTLDEDPAKYFFVLYDDLSLRSVCIETRPIIRMGVTSEQGLDTVVQELAKVVPFSRPPLIQKPIWHIEYFDDVPGVIDRISKLAEGKAFFFPRPKSREAKGEQEDSIVGEETDMPNVQLQGGLEQHLPEAVSPDKPVFNTCLRMLRSNDPKAELERMTEEVKSMTVPLESWNP